MERREHVGEGQVGMAKLVIMGLAGVIFVIRSIFGQLNYCRYGLGMNASGCRTEMQSLRCLFGRGLSRRAFSSVIRSSRVFSGAQFPRGDGSLPRQACLASSAAPPCAAAVEAPTAATHTAGDSSISAGSTSVPTFQEAIARLQDYWASVGCAVWLPHNTEVRQMGKMEVQRWHCNLVIAVEEGGKGRAVLERLSTAAGAAANLYPESGWGGHHEPSYLPAGAGPRALECVLR